MPQDTEQERYLRKIPQFADFLSQYGLVKITETNRTIKRWGIRYDDKLHKGKVMDLHISNIYFGKLEFYEYPSGVIFEGKLPTKRSKTRAEKFFLHIPLITVEMMDGETFLFLSAYRSIKIYISVSLLPGMAFFNFGVARSAATSHGWRDST